MIGRGIYCNKYWACRCRHLLSRLRVVRMRVIAAKLVQPRVLYRHTASVCASNRRFWLDNVVGINWLRY
jgi:hypothetical protein